MRTARLLVLIAAAAIAAIALPALVLPLAGPAEAARVVFLGTVDPASLPDGVSIDRWLGQQAILSGVDARTARALYRSGAILVYPVRSAGCFAVSEQ